MPLRAGREKVAGVHSFDLCAHHFTRQTRDSVSETARTAILKLKDLATEYHKATLLLTTTVESPTFIKHKVLAIPASLLLIGIGMPDSMICSG